MNSSLSASATRKRRIRQSIAENETTEEKQARLEKASQERKQVRDRQTAKQKRATLDRANEQRKNASDKEAAAQKRARLDRANEQRKKSSDREAAEQKRARLDRANEQRKKSSDKEAAERKRARLDRANEQRKKASDMEAAEQKRARLDRANEQRRKASDMEAAEQKRARLDRANEQRKKASDMEAAEQKRARLDRKNQLRNETREEERRVKIQVTGNNPTQYTRAAPLSKSYTFRKLAQDAEKDESRIPENYLGPMDLLCKHCNSLNFSGEKTGRAHDEFTRCCEKGQIKLDPLRNYPTFLKNLLTNQVPHSKNFMSCIRSYNSSHAFASTGANIKAPPGNGPYCFRVCGQIVHRTGTLHPDDQKQPTYSQLYILDPDDAVMERMKLNKDCDKYVMEGIGKIMEENPFVQSFKMLHEVEKEANAKAESEGIVPTRVMLAIVQDPKNDPRRYNAPLVNEVAVVFQSKDGEPPLERDIIIHLRPDATHGVGKLRRISILNPNLDAFAYPILYPHGEKGWHTNLHRIKKHEEQKRFRVSIREYFSYRFSIRNEYSPVFDAGKLFQQYSVDAYVRAEANDLQWIKDNQPTLRSEKYKGLMDYISNDSETKSVAGKSVVLPSSFQGSPRNMHQNYQDAMAIVTKYGKPDLFVTMTCNPKWKEIVENLRPWQRAEHRPDLVARVFNLKLKSLLHDITDKDTSIFGHVQAKVHVIEFQKRGLPHAHILVILDKQSKIETPEEIDLYVKAELPDKETSPTLYDIITRNMIHTPCGVNNQSSPCMRNGKCSKNFPKEIVDITTGNSNGYPKYKRSKIDPVLIKGRWIDNSWVVPYNPYLCLKYNCHINVEIVATVKSVKYLFKYIHKGHDCANVCVTESNEQDESKEYVDSRYVSAPEAIWRLFSMRLHDQSHTIVRLPVHLEDQQSICFKVGSEKTAIDKANKRFTKLTGWFELNKTDTSARQLRYWDIPKSYTWDDKKTIWNKRKRGGDKVIGRMYSVTFKDQERYFLRILLAHETGVTSFENLKKCRQNDQIVVCTTFQEAAKLKGYILSETVWQETLDEAKMYQLSPQLRQLFAYICGLGTFGDHLQLWNDNKEGMFDDICRRLHPNTSQCVNCELYAFKDIRETLTILNKDYADYGFPDIPPNLIDLNEIHYHCAEEMELADQMIETLTSEQKHAFDSIMNAVISKTPEPKCFFLDGPGGSGKTYLYTVLLHFFRGKSEIVLPAASTGIAANLLKGGRTFHSLYKLPIPILEDSVSSMSLTSKDADLIRQAKLLIIDECTMASSHAMNTIDRLLRELMDSRSNKEIAQEQNVGTSVGTYFGGKVILLGGDFRQCLNIVPHAQRPAIVQSCLKYCNAWKDGHFNKLSLITNMRSEDQSYSEWLLKLGDGTLSNNVGLGDDMIEIPKSFVCVGSLVKEIFGSKISEDLIPLISKRAILCPKNTDVDLINDEIISLLDGNPHTFLSDDSVITDDEEEKANFPIEFLNTINLSGWPPNKLTLRVGTIIMLLRNFNTKRGLCNGTRLVVRDMTNNVIRADVLTSNGFGQTVLIPRIDFCSSPTDLPFKMRRRQFPVKAAFAMTINKSQGQTLEKVGIYLADPVFGHGQLYVAFSRVRRACDVKVKIVETKEQGMLIEGSDTVYTKNVVYKEVFNLNNN